MLKMHTHERVCVQNRGTDSGSGSIERLSCACQTHMHLYRVFLRSTLATCNKNTFDWHVQQLGNNWTICKLDLNCTYVPSRSYCMRVNVLNNLLTTQSQPGNRLMQYKKHEATQNKNNTISGGEALVSAPNFVSIFPSAFVIPLDITPRQNQNN